MCKGSCTQHHGSRLTGTPIEAACPTCGRLFDFLNPGLLGGAKAFGAFVKRLQKQEPRGLWAAPPTRGAPISFGGSRPTSGSSPTCPTRPVKAFCNLSPQQAKLYEQSVGELSAIISKVEGIQRRGVVLSFLMRLKQICNHPSNGWRWQLRSCPWQIPATCGTVQELAERQEKVQVFTQFREIAELSGHLQEIFRRPGLVLTGSTAVGKRRDGGGVSAG